MTALAYTIARARELGAGAARLVPPRHELLVFAGFAMVGVGVAMVYVPAGVVVAGLALVAWGVGEAKFEASGRSRR